MTSTHDSAEPSRTSELAADLRLILVQLRRRLLAQADIGELTNSQWAVLTHLEKSGPSTVTELARVEGIRSQSMGSTVASLESAGLVVGNPDPDDGRRTIYSVTPACRKFIENGRAVRQDWLVRALNAKLVPEEQETLADAVSLLRRLVEP